MLHGRSLRLALPFLLFFGAGSAACAAGGDDGASSEDALATCTTPDAGPLQPASRWVKPGSFVNIALASDGVDLRVEPMPGATGRGTPRKFGLAGKPSFVVEFDNTSKGFFRVVGSRQGRDVGEVRVRVSDAVPHLRLGTLAGGKVDPVVLLEGGSARLTGTIADELGSPALVSIAGAKQPVQNGQFSITMPSGPGVHLVDAEVIDASCNSYPVTSAFVAATGRGGDGRVKVRAAQSAVDQIAKLISQHFGEVVKLTADPNPITSILGQKIFLDGIDFPTDPNSVHVSITVADGRFALHFTVDGQLITRARINSTPTTVKIDNFVLDGTVSVSADGHFGLDVSNVDGHVSVDVGSFGVPFLGLFQGVIKDQLAKSVKQFAPKFIEKALAGQAGDIPIPVPWASTHPATVHYALAGVGVTRAGFNVDVKTTVPNSPQFAPPASIAAPGDGELGIGLSYATINQALYALWLGGNFNPTLSNNDVATFSTGAGMPPFLKGMQIDIAVDNPLVPPIVLPSADGKLVHVGIGELPLHVFAQGSGTSTKLEADVSIVGDFAVRTEGGELRVDIVKAEPHARLTGRVDLNASLDDITTLMKDLSVRLAAFLALKSVTMPVPAFDLSNTGVEALRGTQVTTSHVALAVTPSGIAVSGAATFSNSQ